MERCTYVSNVLVRISTLSRHHDDRPLDIRWLDSLSIATERVVVDEREMVVGTRRIPDLKVSNLRATPLRKGSRNRISSVLLGQDRGTEERERAEARERHRERKRWQSERTNE